MQPEDKTRNGQACFSAAQFQQNCASSLFVFFDSMGTQNTSSRTIINNLHAVIASAKSTDDFSFWIKALLAVLFSSRDPRIGRGMVRTFDIGFIEFAKLWPDAAVLATPLIKSFGSCKDYRRLYPSMPAPVQSAFAHEFIVALSAAQNPGSAVSIGHAKWCPRANYKSEKQFAYQVAEGIFPFVTFRTSKSLSEKRRLLRKFVARLRCDLVVQPKMCAKEPSWSKINPAQITAATWRRLRKAFLNPPSAKRSVDRLECSQNCKRFLQSRTIKFHGVMPHEIAAAMRCSNESEVDSAQWREMVASARQRAGDKVFIPMCDVSGSMQAFINQSRYSLMDVSVGMCALLSEIGNEETRNRVLTFESEPKWVYLTGSLSERICSLYNASWGFSTDFNRAHRMIFDYLKSLKKSPEEVTLVCVTDMQFDQAGANYKSTCDLLFEDYKREGLLPPKVAFVNVAGGRGYAMHPNCKNVRMISGFSPNLLDLIMQDDMRATSSEEGVIKHITQKKWRPIWKTFRNFNFTGKYVSE